MSEKKLPRKPRASSKAHKPNSPAVSPPPTPPTTTPPVTPPAAATEQPPEVLVVDVTPKLYKEMKTYYLGQVPQVARHFVNQYFDFIKQLDPYDVIEWLEKGKSLKQLYEEQTFPEKIAIAGARGLIRSIKRIRVGADRAINFEVTCYTLRFENPAVWEVVTVFGEGAFDKLKQGIDDIKEILKLKEAAA